MDQIVFAHLSDFHFGLPLGDRRYPLIALPALTMTGRMPHDPVLADSLPIALKEVGRRLAIASLEDFRVLITGDLTSGGAPRELEWVSEYLHQEIPRSPGDPSLYGLGIDRKRYGSIAGNHDHWNDGSWLARPSFQKWIYAPGVFDLLPRVWTSPTGSFRVEIYSIDSSSGVPSLLENSRANGHIAESDQIRLERQLDSADKSGTTVRVIACHHSIDYNSNESNAPVTSLDSIVRANRLDPKSRSRLEQVARRNNVSVILTGHIHCFQEPHRIVSWKELNNPRPMWEITCTTTLKSRRGHNGFWVHQVVRENGQLAWIPHRWRYRDDDRLFVYEGAVEPIRGIELHQ